MWPTYTANRLIRKGQCLSGQSMGPRINGIDGIGRIS